MIIKPKGKNSSVESSEFSMRSTLDMIKNMRAFCRPKGTDKFTRTLKSNKVRNNFRKYKTFFSLETIHSSEFTLNLSKFVSSNF